MKTAICPACENQGVKVSLKTVARVLNRQLYSEESLGLFYACTSPYCFAAYYKQDGTIFPIHEVKTLSHLKAFYSNPVICHCGGVTVDKIKEIVLLNGATTIREIADKTGATRHGRCDQTNPSGKCCLEDIKSLLDGLISE